MDKINVIFTDVDGVLNCGFDVQIGEELEASKLSLLSDLVKTTGAKLVLSSTWGMDRMMLDRIQTGFRNHDLYLYGNVHVYQDGGFIPGNVLPDKDLRIIHWLAKHPEVENYVVVDDWDYSSTFRDNFVRTWEKNRYGLDAGFCAEIAKKLSQK